MGHYSEYYNKAAEKKREEKTAQFKALISEWANTANYEDLELMNKIIKNWNSLKSALKLLKEFKMKGG